MKPTRKVTVNGTEFPLYELHINEIGNEGVEYPIIVGNYELNELIEEEMSKSPHDIDIECLDDEIYAFLPQKILDKSEEDIVKYFNENYD